MLSKKGDEGFVSIFDGKTLDGWAGAVENYEVPFLQMPYPLGHPRYELGGFFATAEFAMFRQDNPLFSGLRMSDGWLVAGDLAHRRLECQLATLSACRRGRG